MWKTNQPRKFPSDLVRWGIFFWKIWWNEIVFLPLWCERKANSHSTRTFN
nr:MAG TPA: hypothetical protein [Caudoviricetes sp.]